MAIKQNKNIDPSQKYSYKLAERGDCIGSHLRYAMAIGYGIFNQSDHDIYASSVVLGNMKVPSQYNKYHSSYQEGILLEVSVYIDSMSYNECYKRIPANTPLDIAIKEIIIYQIQQDRELKEYSEIINTDIKFRLSLNTVAPSKGENGYYSELLGLYISTGYKDLIYHLAEIPEALSEKINRGNTAYTEYQMSYIIDNDNEIGNVWTMINGQPVMLRRSKQAGQASGLYIFNKETAKTQLGYKYLTVNEVNNKDILSAEGYALSEEALAEKNHTKEYKILKEIESQYANLKDEFKALRKFCDMIEAEKEKLETNIEVIVDTKVKQITDVYDKTTKELNATHDKIVRDINQSHAREIKDLQRDLQRAKKLLSEEQSDYTKKRKDSVEFTSIATTLIGCTVTMGRFIMDLFKFFNSNKQMR